MKNRNIYIDVVRWMFFPILINVFYELLKITMMFVMASFLGDVTDAAIEGNYAVFSQNCKALLVVIGITAFCLPLSGIIMDFIWIKAGSVSDTEMCSKISHWKYNKLRKIEEGDIEYKLSEELCDFRISFANASSTLLLVPVFLIFLKYCEKKMGAIYLLLAICCSLLTLILPIIFNRINLKYEQENWDYLSKQNQIFTEISKFALPIKILNIGNIIVKKWEKIFEEHYNKSRKKGVKIRNFTNEINAFMKAGSQIAILVLGCVLLEKQLITTGCIVIMLQFLSIFDIFFGYCIQSITNISKVKVKGERLRIFYDDFECEEGEGIIDNIHNISCENLCYEYGNNRVIENLTFSIKQGEKVYICGENGSGKSTLLKILCGLETEYKGRVLINGIDLKKINLSLWRKKLTVIFQNAYIFPGTVEENVWMGDFSETKEEVEKQMYALKINDMSLKEIGYGATELSGGEKQRIAMARAFLKKSEVILLDEGDNHLDTEGRRRLYDYIRKTNQTVIFISHNLEFGDLADRKLSL